MTVVTQVVNDSMRAVKLHAQADDIDSALIKEHEDIGSYVVMFAKVCSITSHSARRCCMRDECVMLCAAGLHSRRLTGGCELLTTVTIFQCQIVAEV